VTSVDVATPGPQGNELYPAPAPSEQDLLAAMGETRRKATAEFASPVVDPQIGPRDRLLTGAAVHAGKPGADLDAYEVWRSEKRMEQSPMPLQRAGISTKQQKLLDTADDKMEQGRILAGGADDGVASAVGAWIDRYESNNRLAAPVDVARFDRLASEGLVKAGSERVGKLYGDLKAGRLGDLQSGELDSTVTKVARALDSFDDDFSIGRNGKLVGVDVDPDVRLHVRYAPGDDGEPVSAPGALAALPGDWMPQSALKGAGPRGDDLDLYVGETDAVVIGKVDRIDDFYRRGFPAVEGERGARWMSVRPVIVRDPASVQAAATRNPTAQVDVHLGVYPGLLPYDSLVFDMDQPNQRIQQLGATRLGRGIAQGPKLSPRPVTGTDLIDVSAANKFLDETMWAVFPGDAKLNARYDRIPVTSGSRTGVLVFGITPAEAAEVSAYAFVNDGIATRNDDYDDIVDAEMEGDETDWTFTTADGDIVRLGSNLEESPLIVERRSKPVDRWHMPIDERARPYVQGLADHFETVGAANLRAYLSTPQVDGFERVREHVYGDGGSGYTVARTADPVIGDPNGLPVWVRRADELPRKWLQIPGDAIDTIPEEMTARKVGGRWRIDARGEDDIGSKIRQAHALAGKYGYDAVELVGDDGPIQLVKAR
jgi:hypothetical protein